MTPSSYPKADKYTKLSAIYTECSGPGGLRLTEFMAEKMNLRPGARLLDIGIERGYQSCFLAKEYGAQVIGLDPDDDRADSIPHLVGRVQPQRSILQSQPRW